MRNFVLCGLLTLAAGGVLSAQLTIVNGASFRGEQPLSPGSLASAFGSFGAVATTSFQNFPLPTTLAGVSVRIGDVAAPLVAVSATQVNFQIPGSVAPGRYPVRVTNGSTNVDGNVLVMHASPGIFVLDRATPAQGAILNQDGAINGSSAPAARGSVIVIYGTGPGPLDGQLADGAAAGSTPLLRTRSTPKVMIGGVAATVNFSGMAPGFAGLWQVNAVVPNQPHIAGRTAVQVYMDGVDSNEVALFVAQ
ncbi:MAG: IPT/TIG domain-containing protein [Bryobacteraceae bacterium]